MKIKHAIFLIVFGYCFTIFGALQKILHTPVADNVLMIGAVIKICGFLILLNKLFTSPKFKEFMNL
jgi:hypothetical protein